MSSSTCDPLDESSGHGRSRVAWPVVLIVALFAVGAWFAQVRGSTTGAVLVALDGALVTAYALERRRNKAAIRAELAAGAPSEATKRPGHRRAHMSLR